MKEFVVPDIYKLAMLIVTRDLTKELFRSEIDPRRKESLTLKEFATCLNELRSDDFEFTSQQASNVFLAVTKQARA